MTEDSPDLVGGVFDRVADTYDAVGVDFFQPIADGLVAELAPQPGERCLDVGCGRGAVLFPIARAVAPAGRSGKGSVVGIDLSPNMVAATAADVAGTGLPIDVRVGDAQSPGVAAGSFDLVSSSLVLFFLPDPVAALRAWNAALVPGGRVGVSTFGDYSPGWREVDAVFAPYLPKQMADPRTLDSQSPFATDAGVERLLTDAGFTEVRTVQTTVAVRFIDEEQWHRWTWSQGQRRMWEAVPEEHHSRVRAAAAEPLERMRDDQGRLGFDQIVRFTLGRAPV
jgi:ubiquinone/menaquinone biosynthesis C-methylase UbiE